MPAELALLAAPSPLWRVERIDPALRFSQLNPVDVMNERAGNRFDIPGSGVLYGATTPEGSARRIPTEGVDERSAVSCDLRSLGAASVVVEMLQTYTFSAEPVGRR